MLKQRLIIINPECLSLYFIISWPSNYYSISYMQKNYISTVLIAREKKYVVCKLPDMNTNASNV